MGIEVFHLKGIFLSIVSIASQGYHSCLQISSPLGIFLNQSQTVSGREEITGCGSGDMVTGGWDSSQVHWFQHSAAFRHQRGKGADRKGIAVPSQTPGFDQPALLSATQLLADLTQTSMWQADRNLIFFLPPAQLYGNVIDNTV